jgi:excisionase family DNA binding protein
MDDSEAPPRTAVAVLLTTEQVAAACQVSTKTIYRAIARGRLVASQLGRGGAYRVRPQDMERWITGSRVDRRAAEPAKAVTTLRSRPMRRRAGGRLEVTEGMGRLA